MIGILYRAADALRRRQRADDHGRLGEDLAHRYIRQRGCTVVARNYRTRSGSGEIDLVAWDGQQLVFVEVKTRSSEDWTRPAAAVNARKRRLLTKTALDYLRLIQNPPIKLRFDIVEVLLKDGVVDKVRHLPNSFPMATPYRYG